MSAVRVIVLDECKEQSAQMHLVQHDDVIEQFAPARSNPTLDAAGPDGLRRLPAGDHGGCAPSRASAVSAAGQLGRWRRTSVSSAAALRVSPACRYAIARR